MINITDLIDNSDKSQNVQKTPSPQQSDELFIKIKNEMVTKINHLQKKVAGKAYNHTITKSDSFVSTEEFFND